jgi:hypothetical protein
VAISAVKDYKNKVRKNIHRKGVELRRANILKAIKRNNTLFFKAPNKLIKR